MASATPEPAGASPHRPLDVRESLTGRYWTLHQVDERAVRQLAAAAGVSDLAARLLAARDIRPDEADGFLSPTLRDLFPDPSSFADMDKAAEIALDALETGKNVTVFADYDVDGGTASAILARYWRAWGQEIGLYVPDRLTEGYGPSPEAFEALKAAGQELVITVDCGAAARAALERAAEIDLPVIVLDHHLMQGARPPAAALVNPNRPDCNSGCGHLAGAGVAFVFAAALNRLARQRGAAPTGGLPDLMAWLDLCALGTLCDMAPLTGVNRAFAIQGLKIMARGGNPGLRALADVAGLGEINSVYHATFMLGPRLNAGGRIGDPWLAAKLLAVDDRGEAIALAERLHALNDDRKAVEAAILEAAEAQCLAALERDPDRAVLVASGEGWHPGVVGIVAGRLKDRFHLPAIVIGHGEGLGPVAKGSARSVPGVNIGDAIAKAAREGLLAAGGGHAMAGGLSVATEGIEAFSDWINAEISALKTELAAARALRIDGLLAPGAATVALAEEIEKLGPYGAGAPQPVFALANATVSGAARIGANHLRFNAEDGSGRVGCVAWRIADTPLGEALRGGGRFHLAGKLKADAWNGRRRVQIEVLDASRA